MKRNKSLDFNEKFYLELYPDVRKNKFKFGLTGRLHWERFGRKEGRIYSKGQVGPTKEKPRLGKGLFRPVAFEKSLFVNDFVPARLEARENSLLVLLPDLSKDLVFAGYSSFFRDLEKIADLFADLIFVVFNPIFEADALPASLGGTVISIREFESDPFEPTLLLSYDARTNLYAIENLSLAEKTIYYCQDLEAGFHPFGSLHIWSLRSLFKSRHLVVSTKELLEDLESRDLVSTSSICVIQPSIEVVQADPVPEKRLFCYFRPEGFNSRNLAEHIWVAVKEFCEFRTGWTILLVGTQGTELEMSINGNDIVVLSKLPKEKYLYYLKSSFLTVSFIFSSHPGVFSFQSAFSGIKTITNVFGNRTKESLKAHSDKLLGIDLVRDDLVEALLRETEHPGDRKMSSPPASQETFRSFVIGVRSRNEL